MKTNDKLIIRALNGETLTTPPIWMMRQAGRYHNHYQQLKQKYTFEQLCREPDLACEVTLGPIQEFDFDAAIIFSDILILFFKPIIKPNSFNVGIW